MEKEKGRKWKPDQKAKFIATMKAKREGRDTKGSQRDAVLYLRAAKRYWKGPLDKGQLLALLALATLEGK